VSTTTRGTRTQPPVAGAPASAAPTGPTPTDERRSLLRAATAAAGRALAQPMTSFNLVTVSGLLLLVLGLAEVLSASSIASYLVNDRNSYAVVARQATWALIALPFTAVAVRVSPRVLRIVAWPALLVSVGLLALTYVPHFGVSVNGNRNWLSFGGPLQIQPSEFAKLALVVWVAAVLSTKEKLLSQWRHLLVPLIPVCLGVSGLVVGQGDAGTAVIFFAIAAGTLFLVGAPLRAFLVATAVGLGALAVLIVTHRNRLARLVSFANPFADQSNSGYQAVQAVYAFATGGWWGYGLGASRQKWGRLPEAYTDFIFAIIGEELGLIGALSVVVLFGVLGYAGFRIAARSRDLFAVLLAGGITVWMLTQACVNMATVLGLLPIAGIPLPLVSYGGSALVPTMVAIGLLAGLARREPAAELYLRARAARRRRLRRERREALA